MQRVDSNQTKEPRELVHRVVGASALGCVGTLAVVGLCAAALATITAAVIAGGVVFGFAG